MAPALLFTLVVASAAPDLASPAQETRDAAASTIRAQKLVLPRAKWDAFIAQKLPLGIKKATVLARLKPLHAEPGPGAAGGGSEQESYRLDDAWTLQCAYGNADHKLFHVDLVESWRHVWVEPPAGFTGVWTTYFANGERSHEIHYADGKYAGVFTSFHPNGAKAVVQTYDALGAQGEDTGFFPSGAVSYRGRYKDGKQVGTWTWFKEDGTVASTRTEP